MQVNDKQEGFIEIEPDLIVIQNSKKIIQELGNILGLEFEIKYETTGSYKNGNYLQIGLKTKIHNSQILEIEWEGMFLNQVVDNKRYIYAIFLLYILGERVISQGNLPKSIVVVEYNNSFWQQPKWEFDETGEWDSYSKPSL